MQHPSMILKPLLSRKYLALLIICMIFWTTAFSVRADNLEACRRYATEAVRQNEQNKKLKAGFTGPAWSSNYDDHFNWCRQGNNLASTPDHLAFREKALQQFAVKSGSDAAKRYATEAVRQNNESQFMGANFPPPVWSPDFNGHYNWSRHGNNIATTPDHLAFREKTLQQYAVKHNKGPRIVLFQPIKVKPIQGKIAQPKQPGKDAVIKKAEIPDLGKVAAKILAGKKTAVMDRSDLLRQKIMDHSKAKFTVTPNKTFSIPTGKLDTRVLFDVPEPGLYKIHINLAPSVPYCSISPRVDQEKQALKIAQPGPLQSPTTIFDKPVAQKVSGGGFKSWIVSHDSLSTQFPRPSDYYIWIDKEHLPASGKLQLRFEVVSVQKNTASGSTGEIGESGFKAAQQTAIKDHAPVKGNFSVEHVIPYYASLSEKFDINGAFVPYSIVTLPSAIESGSDFSVIRTPVIELKAGDPGAYQSPTLSFFVANAEQLSSKTPPAGPQSSSGIMLSQVPNPNAWVYKEILSREYGRQQICSAVSKNGSSVCAKQKRIRYYAWDKTPAGYNGSFLYDVTATGTGTYATIVSNNPVDSRLISPERFSTTGVMSFGEGPRPGDDLKNEVLVAARHSKPMKWTYVAELARLDVSEQAETDDDDQDDYFGEFSVLTTSILTEPLSEEQLAVGTGQIVNRSMPYPLVDNEDRPHNFSLRPLGNPGGKSPGNAQAKVYPKVPIFVMDQEKMEQYDSLVMNVIMTEHDEMTFWQENGNVIKAFGNFCKSIGSMVKSGFDAVGLAKSIYTFAKTDLNPSLQVDDFMGNAAISVFKNDQFGLIGTDRAVFSITGPADPNCFDMAYNAGNKGRASVSSSAVGCGNSRQVSALVKIRRVPQLNSWADIQLISYTPIVDPQWELMPDHIKKMMKDSYKRDQHLTEGFLSNSRTSWDLKTFKDVKAGHKIIVRKAQMPKAPNSLNKGVFKGSEHNRGQLTLNSQKWQGKGFTYYQALLEDVSVGRFPAANISLTLYHEDVIKYAGEKGIRWLDLDGNTGTMGIVSRKVPGTYFYRVDIKLVDSGDWVESVDLVAWVYINE